LNRSSAKNPDRCCLGRWSQENFVTIFSQVANWRVNNDYASGLRAGYVLPQGK